MPPALPSPAQRRCHVGIPPSSSADHRELVAPACDAGRGRRSARLRPQRHSLAVFLYDCLLAEVTPPGNEPSRVRCGPRRGHPLCTGAPLPPGSRPLRPGPVLLRERQCREARRQHACERGLCYHESPHGPPALPHEQVAASFLSPRHRSVSSPGDRAQPVGTSLWVLLLTRCLSLWVTVVPAEASSNCRPCHGRKTCVLGGGATGRTPDGEVLSGSTRAATLPQFIRCGCCLSLAKACVPWECVT